MLNNVFSEMDIRQRRLPERNRGFPSKPGSDPNTVDFGNKLTHPGCLDRLTLAALGRGDAAHAFRYIDRRCRIMPPASAYHYVLRAEALMQISEPAAALASLDRALAMAPEDLQANRRMLAWGRDEKRSLAAKILCRNDDHPPVLIEAAKVLKRAGCCAIGSIKIFDTYLRGWVAWNGNHKPELAIFGDDFKELILLEADPHSFLKGSGFRNRSAFEWKRNPNQNLQHVRLQYADQIVVAERISSNSASRARSNPMLKRGSQKETPRLTIIVPIYRDFAATRSCLESLKREVRHLSEYELILVNDASPETEIAPYLEKFAKRLGATLLTNKHNMGFVGAVNRALDLVKGGDVILLNADTVLPGDAFARLMKTAHANPNIGTITPLSNNGEFTSFPRPAVANPMPNAKELAALDRVAARVNEKLIIDIPSGIGFCLFISATCFAAVGRLSDHFQGGYLEDVDFCLRARELGFRNVCDPAIFVAHAGSRSFLADKRNLVIRNLPIIEERFPADKTETQRFLQLDPLRQARAAIERALIAKNAFDPLIVTGTGTAKTIAEARARALSQKGSRVWFAFVSNDTVRLADAGGRMPQSLSFRLDRKGDCTDLESCLADLKFNRIELADPARLSPTFLKILEKGGRPFDLLVLDAGWLLEKSQCLNHESFEDKALVQNILGKIEWIIVPCKAAHGFVKHLLPNRENAVVVENIAEEQPAAVKRGRRKTSDRGKTPACGIITFGRSGEDFRLIKDLAMEMRPKTKGQSFIVLAETFNDLALMALDNVFITAAKTEGELALLCKLYGIEKLFAATRRPVFGHPLMSEVRAAGLPLSYFDWSFGTCRPKRGDLPLDPTLDVKSMARLLATWIAPPR